MNIHVAFDRKGEAEGEIYVDDGSTYDYQEGKYMRLKIRYNTTGLFMENSGSGFKANIKKVYVYGAQTIPVVGGHKVSKEGELLVIDIKRTFLIW